MWENMQDLSFWIWLSSHSKWYSFNFVPFFFSGWIELPCVCHFFFFFLHLWTDTSVDSILGIVDSAAVRMEPHLTCRLSLWCADLDLFGHLLGSSVAASRSSSIFRPWRNLHIDSLSGLTNLCPPNSVSSLWLHHPCPHYLWLFVTGMVAVVTRLSWILVVRLAFPWRLNMSPICLLAIWTLRVVRNCHFEKSLAHL